VEVLRGVREVREDEYLAPVARVLVADPLGTSSLGDRDYRLNKGRDFRVVLPRDVRCGRCEFEEQFAVGLDRGAQGGDVVKARMVGIVAFVRFKVVHERLDVVRVTGDPGPQGITRENEALVERGEEVLVRGGHGPDRRGKRDRGGLEALEERRLQQARVLNLVLLLGVGRQKETGRHVPGHGQNGPEVRVRLSFVDTHVRSHLVTIRAERGGETVEEPGKDLTEAVVDTVHDGLREHDAFAVDLGGWVLRLDESPGSAHSDRIKDLEQVAAGELVGVKRHGAREVRAQARDVDVCELGIGWADVRDECLQVLQAVIDRGRGK
jgi:hypothetical protein